MSGSVTEVRLELLGPMKLAYTDDRHIGHTFHETIDTDVLRKNTTEWLSRSVSQKVDFCDEKGCTSSADTYTRRVLRHHRRDVRRYL